GTTLGTSPNGIRFGARISSIGSASSHKFKVFTSLYNTRSTNRYGLLAPPHGSRLDIALKDKSGKEVPRTRAGSALCRPVTDHLWSRENIVLLTPEAGWNLDAHFDLRSCF